MTSAKVLSRHLTDGGRSSPRTTAACTAPTATSHVRIPMISTSGPAAAKPMGCATIMITMKTVKKRGCVKFRVWFDLSGGRLKSFLLLHDRLGFGHGEVPGAAHSSDCSIASALARRRQLRRLGKIRTTRVRRFSS